VGRPVFRCPIENSETKLVKRLSGSLAIRWSVRRRTVSATMPGWCRHNTAAIVEHSRDSSNNATPRIHPSSARMTTGALTKMAVRRLCFNSLSPTMRSKTSWCRRRNTSSTNKFHLLAVRRHRLVFVQDPSRRVGVVGTVHPVRSLQVAGSCRAAAGPHAVALVGEKKKMHCSFATISFYLPTRAYFVIC